jgi:hypothetical protein
MARHPRRFRCPECRAWIDVTANATKMPEHRDILNDKCRGKGKPPAETRAASPN